MGIRGPAGSWNSYCTKASNWSGPRVVSSAWLPIPSFHASAPVSLMAISSAASSAGRRPATSRMVGALPRVALGTIVKRVSTSSPIPAARNVATVTPSTPSTAAMRSARSFGVGMTLTSIPSVVSGGCTSTVTSNALVASRRRSKAVDVRRAPFTTARVTPPTTAMSRPRPSRPSQRWDHSLRTQSEIPAIVVDRRSSWARTGQAVTPTGSESPLSSTMGSRPPWSTTRPSFIRTMRSAASATG